MQTLLKLRLKTYLKTYLKASQDVSRHNRADNAVEAGACKRGRRRSCASRETTDTAKSMFSIPACFGGARPASLSLPSLASQDSQLVAPPNTLESDEGAVTRSRAARDVWDEHLAAAFHMNAIAQHLSMSLAEQADREQLDWLTAEYGTPCERVVHWLKRRL